MHSPPSLYTAKFLITNELLSPDAPLRRFYVGQVANLRPIGNRPADIANNAPANEAVIRLVLSTLPSRNHPHSPVTARISMETT
jgi:hypothetical protein